MQNRLRNKELGDFLKSRRERISPEKAGLMSGGRRRTPGLRREEVAQLAGVGLTWYTWLEQARPINVSPEVLESLSRVLLLDESEKAYLFTLAQQLLPEDVFLSPNGITPTVQSVLDNLPLCPSFIMDRYWNVLAWNKAASVLFGDFSQMEGRERNTIWRMFTRRDYRQLYVHWEEFAQWILAQFRVSCGRFIEDPHLSRFIFDLQQESSEFRDWWARHDVLSTREVLKEVQIPSVGKLVFGFSCFDVTSSPGLTMVVHMPIAGTDTDGKMQKLLSLS